MQNKVIRKDFTKEPSCDLNLEGWVRFGEMERRRPTGGWGEGERNSSLAGQKARGTQIMEPLAARQAGLLSRQKRSTEGLRKKEATCTEPLGLCWE